jgi:endonuclease/exonuclease/phosphatase family metal-dependent hydrolase
MITLMSFNIRTRSANDGENDWQNRRRFVLERIRASSPDLLGLQECRNDAQANFLKRNLTGYGWIGFERGGDPGTAIEMAPILVKRRMFEVLDAGCFWLSETPEIRGSTAWGSHFPRTVTWARLKARRNAGQTLYFLNTHFDYASLQVQVKSARMVRRFISLLAGNPPVILCGDFNSEKNTATYRLLLGGASSRSPRLHDCCLEANPPPWQAEGTFHAFGALENPPALDWILASSHFTATAAATDRYHAGSIYPSDHYPLICKVELL